MIVAAKDLRVGDVWCGIRLDALTLRPQEGAVFVYFDGVRGMKLDEDLTLEIIRKEEKQDDKKSN